MKNFSHFALRGLFLTAALVLTIGALPAYAQKNKPFKQQCTLPFNGEGHTIDDTCGRLGSTNNPNGQLQNSMKNNFCADNAPIKLTFGDFKRLQQITNSLVANGKLTYGGDNALPSLTMRQPLQKMFKNSSNVWVGEGKRVTVEAYVSDARHSNTKFIKYQGTPGSGETVNCKSGEIEDNDIHIDLSEVESGGTACDNITAEISPHFRPEVWNRFDTNKTTGKLVNGLPLEGMKVRITGHLFFDGSHKPCNSMGQGSPKRMTVWEIHPVYAIEVFDADKNKWTSLEAWAANK